MGQMLRGSAATTHAGRAAIQRSQASTAELSRRYGINPKTVAKWRKRETVDDVPMGPKERRSSVLGKKEEALVVTFRRHTLLPLDDCLYALQPTIPHLTRSSLHRCFLRHEISRLPEVEGSKPKAAFKAYPIGFFHIDIAEVRTEEGKLHLLVAIDRTSKFAFAEVHERVTRRAVRRLEARPESRHLGGAAKYWATRRRRRASPPPRHPMGSPLRSAPPPWPSPSPSVGAAAPASRSPEFQSRSETECAACRPAKPCDRPIADDREGIARASAATVQRVCRSSR
jgi:hypothetical protein